MNSEQFRELLIKLNACNPAIDWAEGKSWEEVYNTCHRGDWLLWLYKKTNKDNLRKLTLAKGLCANTVRHLMKDERSVAAVFELIVAPLLPLLISFCCFWTCWRAYSEW